jgi:DNA replication protein DnaC
MKANDKVDAARVDLLLAELRLSGLKLVWSALAATADKEGWPAARFLAALAEQELADRGQRRFARHLVEARLPPGKTLDVFDFDTVPMISKAQVQALAAGDAWLEKGANLLFFGPPGVGKSHLAAALGLALIENGWRVLFTRTTDLVQKLQVARRDLALEAAIDKLDKYHLLILDDIAYVAKDQAETSVLFELISARYERRSLLITANQPFGEWGKIFPDQAMTLAAIDRLVHHATIFEMNVDSYRRKAALKKARWSRPAFGARDNQDIILIVAPRQSNRTPLKIPLAILSLRDNHLVTATEESHPDCRALLILIVAPYPREGHRSARPRPF